MFGGGGITGAGKKSFLTEIKLTKKIMTYVFYLVTSVVSLFVHIMNFLLVSILLGLEYEL